MGGVGFIASTFGSVIVMWKVFRGVERFLAIPDQIDAIVYQLHPNGGESFRDGFDELRHEAKETRSAIAHLTNTIQILQRTFKLDADREDEFRRKLLDQMPRA